MNGATVIPQQAPKIVRGFKQLGPSCRIVTPNGAEKDLFKAASGIFSDVPNQKQFAGIKGIQNLDNTCFMNSVLQCMTHCEPLLRKIEAMNHPKCKSGTICYICGLKELLNDIMRGEKATLSPQKFATDLTNVMTNFTLGQQADVQEYFCNFIQRLGGLSGVFFGLMTTKLWCGRCSARGGSVSPLADLSVDVSSAATLTQALDSQFAPETLDDYVCAGCRCVGSVEKTELIAVLPEVLVFHLKRFAHDGVSMEKLGHFVAYPAEIEMAPYMSCRADQRTVYELSTVVEHRGGCGNFGHYVSIILHDSAWYICNDTEVTQVDQEEALKSSAYLLMYTKRTY